MNPLKRLLSLLGKPAPAVPVASPPPEPPSSAITDLAAAVQQMRTRVDDLDASLAQLLAILKHDGTVLAPPKHLQVRVVGSYVPGFIESGFSICDDLTAVLGTAGKRLADFPRILDWGCGCGRTIRALKTLLPSCELHGTDIDPEAIGWLQRCYGRYAQFHLAPHRPPTAFPKGHFDLVVGISVFTHLPEDMQFEWLEELRRITKPGGYLVMTTSGEKNYGQLAPDLLEKLQRYGFLYMDGGYGQSINLPPFYQNAFHTQDYVRREWGRYFTILDVQSARLQTFLDTILLQNPV